MTGFAKSGKQRKFATARQGWLPSMWRATKRHWFVYVGGIILPLILYAIFIGYPILRTLYLSLAEWNGLDPKVTMVGLNNYRTLLDDPIFKLSFVNNIKWAVLTLLFPVVAGLLFAVFLHSGKVAFAGLFRSTLFLPATMSLVAIGIMFSLILNPIFGALNEGLRAIGLGFLTREWLGDPNTALYTLLFVFGWFYTGLPLMLFHAGISEIPAELFEAATIEGANGLQTFWYVTLPSLKSVTTVITMLTVITSLKAFDLVMVMTRGGPFNQTSVLGYFMYTESFWNYRFGYGAAISVVILLLSSVFAAIYLRNVAGESLYVS
ncbi:MAG: sugar ABC transporter permease [Chloroflexi bacterium]|nr:sugar ABC transporter permease [Chloroflexota bacterium]